MKVVFVCTGNTCRSPLAEYVLRGKLKKRGVEDVEVQSAGTAAASGVPMTENSRIILEEQGYGSPSRHRSRNIMDLELEAGDLLLTMTENHLRSLPPFLAEEGVDCSLLREYVGESGEFSDPFGGSLDRYRRLYEDLEPVLEKLAEKLSAGQNV
ncbi:MAG: low molecular weight protein arginine phosphatase [bacterium]